MGEREEDPAMRFGQSLSWWPSFAAEDIEHIPGGLYLGGEKSVKESASPLS
jgi:hypothetical protein